MLADAEALKSRLASIRYRLMIGLGFVTVSTYRGEADYGAEIQADFEKFRQDAAADHAFKFNEFPQMNHIEAGILGRVALLFPDIFAELEGFIARNAAFLDPTISRFDREVQFYVAYLAHVRRFEKAGLPFCFPKLSTDSKEEFGVPVLRPRTGSEARRRRAGDRRQRLCPGWRRAHHHRVRPKPGRQDDLRSLFWQLHYLAALGCPVPAESARLFLFDRMFTHFEKEEDIHNLRGKLHDDLTRLRATLSSATPKSIVILNEVFNSTSLEDAVFLSTKVLTSIIALDALCVCVTFIDELASLSPTAVSMASNVKSGDLAQRTFKITRRPPDGLAYAISVAEKYRLTHQQIAERL